IAELLAVRGTGVSKASTLLAQARNAGLTMLHADTWEETIDALRKVPLVPLLEVDESVPDGDEFSRLSGEREVLLEEQRRLKNEIELARAFERDEKGY